MSRRRTTLRLNVSDATFGGSRNAQILSQRLLELGDAKVAWKLKKKFSKTLTVIRILEQIPTHEIKLYLTLLVLRDVVAYVDTLSLTKEVRDRFLGAVRNQCPHGLLAGDAKRAMVV